MMEHNRRAGATLIDFPKKSPFVGNGQFEPRWPQIMQPYISRPALTAFLKRCSRIGHKCLDKSNNQFSQEIPSKFDQPKIIQLYIS